MDVQLSVRLNLGLLRQIILAATGRPPIRRFKQQCDELAKMAELLLMVIEGDLRNTEPEAVANNLPVPVQNNPSIIRTDQRSTSEAVALHNLNPSTSVQHDAAAGNLNQASPLKDVKTWAHLQAILLEVQTLVVKCRGEWNFLQRGWEVFVNRNVLRLKRQLFEWITIFIMETSARTRNELRFKTDRQTATIRQDLQRLVTKSDEAAQQQMDIIRRLGQLRLGEDGDLEHVKFSEGDPRLDIPDSLDGSDQIDGTLRNVGRVICKKIKNDDIIGGGGDFRQVEIYDLISKCTNVEAFYGIAELHGKQYAVMGDLRNDMTLEDAINLKSDRLDDLARLRLAYEVSHTIAYLHSIGIIVKNISDINVVLKNEGESGFVPLLINLTEARKIVEATAFVSYDVRFEAPEYLRQEECQHSKSTDIWGLGVLIWECVTWQYPFLLSAKDISSHPEKIKDVQAQLRNNELPGIVGVNEQRWSDVYTIVQGCWNKKAVLRNAALYVEQALLEIYTHCSGNTKVLLPTIEVGDLEKVKTSVFKQITAKRNHIDACSIAIEHALMLKSSVDKYDPSCSFLVGAAIWHKLVDIDLFADGRLEGVTVPNLKRARLALSYLEVAIDNGQDEARRETAHAYSLLARHYIGLKN